MVLGDAYDLWSFVATHVKLWKSLKEHDVFIADLKRLGSDDSNTSTTDGVSPLKHVGPITKFDKLYKTHESHNTYSYQNLHHPWWMDQWEDSLCDVWHKSEKTISKCLSFTLEGL